MLLIRSNSAPPATRAMRSGPLSHILRWSRKPRSLGSLLLIALGVSPLFAQTAVSRPHVYGIAHVAIYASNFARARTFYKKFLGFDEPFTLKRSDGSDWIAFMKVNDQQYLEVSSGAPAGDRALGHFALYTDDAAAMRAFLASRGVRHLGELHRGNIGNDFFSLRDPDGHLIEIVQYQPESWTGQDRGAHLSPNRISSHIMQLGLRVGAPNPTLKFFTELLGFEELSRGTLNGGQAASITLRVPDGTDRIELLLYRDLPVTVQQSIQDRIYFERRDVAKAVAELQVRNVFNSMLFPNGIPFASNNARQAALYDPDGTLVEIAEPLLPSSAPIPASAAFTPSPSSK